MPKLDKNIISKESVYREMYNEMRRYRDYELNSSKWYSTILIAILGFILKDKIFISKSLDYQTSSKYNLQFIILISIITILIVTASCHGVWVAHKRHDELRRYTNTLEPKWKKFQPSKIAPFTRIFIYVTQIIIGIAILVVVLFF